MTHHMMSHDHHMMSHEHHVMSHDQHMVSCDHHMRSHDPSHDITCSIITHTLGISLWDCVVSNTLARQSNKHVDLLQHYNLLTLPVHAVYVFLLLIVMVSLFDR